jgi:26 proteasome complex subunit DSS1
MGIQTDHRCLLLLDWSKEEEVGASGKAGTTHLWEESWDDDDTTDDFSVQLK